MTPQTERQIGCREQQQGRELGAASHYFQEDRQRNLKVSGYSRGSRADAPPHSCSCWLGVSLGSPRARQSQVALGTVCTWSREHSAHHPTVEALDPPGPGKGPISSNEEGRSQGASVAGGDHPQQHPTSLPPHNGGWPRLTSQDLLPSQTLGSDSPEAECYPSAMGWEGVGALSASKQSLT